MEKDFHFYVTYALAERAGFDPGTAHTMAYASQYVDDNNEGQYPKKDGPSQFPAAIRVRDGLFRPVMTQSLSVKSLVYEIQKFVYVPFHFLPGDNNRPIKGRYNRYSTTPGSENATAVMREALGSGDPYRVGIALHTFADTWSHQNFTGYEEDWNAVFSWRNPFRALAPNIGHADVGHLPDEISTVWNDYRFEKPYRRRENQKIALEACKRIFQELRRATGSGTYWTHVRADFARIIRARDYDERVEAVRDYVGRPDLRYEKDAWVEEAVHGRENEVLEAADRFEETHWYRFQMAAREHLALVMNLLKRL